ncbi:MAG: hypothetical protein K6E98_07710 [Lachnospiraceae bacterium]|nr:hypothetical protein [Lachnospiraceae bacterium]
MSYTSLTYYVMVIFLLPLYYFVPRKIRWIVLLVGSIFFYTQIITDVKQFYFLVYSVILSYLAGIILQMVRTTDRLITKKFILFAGITLSSLPLILEKIRDISSGVLFGQAFSSLVIPVGLSFYTLQLIAYLVDIYRGVIDAQKNPLKYCLFITFFPQIIQGPIPRYDQLGSFLFNGNEYNFNNIIKGVQLVIWGFFLKYMIADKAAIVVNNVFGNPHVYAGGYIWVGTALYCMQLYSDFMSCTTISKGIAEMFGIKLSDNFNHPFFATSTKDFWRRWHISLSYWLRDYIYIPLGGNKRGRVFKWINLTITYAVSGLWHGGSIKYLIWGLCQVFYQIVGEIRNIIVTDFGLEKYSMKNKWLSTQINRLGTTVLFMLSVIIFRADTLQDGLTLIKNMLTVFNPWIFFDDSLFLLGLDSKEYLILILSIMILLLVSIKQESGMKLRDRFMEQNIVIRWVVYLLAIWTIWIFGSYGFGFNSNDFLYGGF